MASMMEQETTVTVNRADEWVHIWTNIPKDARRLEKDSRVVKDSANPEGIGGFYRVPVDQFNVVGGLKRRVKPMTEEQRAAAAERLRSMRGKRGTD